MSTHADPGNASFWQGGQIIDACDRHGHDCREVVFPNRYPPAKSKGCPYKH